MTQLSPCWCCKGQLEPAQQLRFLVETDTLDDPAYLDQIRALPSISGRPIPVCKACQAHIESTQQRSSPKRASLLGTLGALSVGLLLTNLLAPRS